MLAGPGDRRLGRGRGGLLGGGRRRACEELADGLFEVGERGGAGADGDGVEPVELGYGLRLGVERGVGLLPQVVLAVEVDVPAHARGVGADGHGVLAVVGVQVDDQPSFGDVVVDALGLGADLANLVAGAPGHGVVRPGPLGVDLLLQDGVDLGGEAVPPEPLGGEADVVGLLAVDAGQDHRGRASAAEAEVVKVGAGGVARRPGRGGGDGGMVVRVQGEADVGVGGSVRHRESFGYGVRPAAARTAAGRAGCGETAGARLGGPAREVTDASGSASGRVACCQRRRTAVRSARALRPPVINWWTVFAGSSA
ncbi:hypothetical protein ACFW6S_04160 [Streptomyces sp. NPDC058740]|uniref:hypothetical protein n=1 Tax=Streptomyces sp. NPDC058740 TaxID=3346619 RepID=UPI0036CA2DC1